MTYSDTQIARIAHETNRAMQALHEDDMPSLPWAWEPRWLRRTTEAGVQRVKAGMTPEQNHEHWIEWKAGQGWRYGPEKDTEQKLHPCLVPWAELPTAERAKARLFCAVVLALSEEDPEGAK